MSASPDSSGPMSLGMSAPAYWLSPSVLTMTSAPRRMQASRPAENAAARPRLCGNCTTCSTPCRTATPGPRGRPAAGAVVDDQPLDAVDARNGAGNVPQRGRQRLRFVEARDLNDELLHVVVPPEPSTSLAITPSHVICDATAYPASPIDAARARLSWSRAQAAARASGVGSQMKQLTPSPTNSRVPPESRAVTTGLCARND